MTSSSSAPRNTLVFLAELAVIVLLALVFTLTARKVFPVWDDAWRVLMIYVQQSEIYTNAADRPLVAAMEQFFVDRGIPWKTASLLHWLAWIALGLITMQLWKKLFPDHPQYALPAACYALAPLLCQTQYILCNVIFACNIPMLLAYAAILLIWRPNRTDRPFWQISALNVLAIIMVALATLMSEYALSTVAAGVALIALAKNREGESNGDRWKTITLLLGTSIVAYIVYWWSANAGMRQEVRPEMIVIEQTTSRHLAAMGANLVTSCWQGTMGMFLQKVGKLNCDGYVPLFAIMCAGFPLACWVTIAAQRRAKRNFLNDNNDIFSFRKTLMLLAALCAGILPVVLMKRPLGEGTLSRFWLPVLPIATCLTIYLLLCMLRPRARWLIAPVCGFLAGYYTVITAVPTIREVPKVASWSKTMEHYLAPEGLTVAIFDEVKSPNDVEFARDYELTARLVAPWHREKQKRFWAFSTPDIATRYVSGLYLNQDVEVPEIDRFLRGVIRRGPIERLLWVRGENNGSLNIIELKDAPKKVPAKEPMP